MDKKPFKKIALIQIILIIFGFTGECYSQTEQQKEKIVVGAIDIKPIRAYLTLSHKLIDTYFHPVILLLITNNSQSDVKVILFANSMAIIDNLGVELLRRQNIKTAGIGISKQRADDFNRAFAEEKGKFLQVAPKQNVEVLITHENYAYIRDKDLEFYKNHRPKNITITGAIGLMYPDGTTEIRAFSLSEVPIVIKVN